MAFVGQSSHGQSLWQELAGKSGFDVSRLDGDAVFEMLRGLLIEEEGAHELNRGSTGVGPVGRRSLQKSCCRSFAVRPDPRRNRRYRPARTQRRCVVPGRTLLQRLREAT